MHHRFGFFEGGGDRREMGIPVGRMANDVELRPFLTVRVDVVVQTFFHTATSTPTVRMGQKGFLGGRGKPSTYVLKTKGRGICFFSDNIFWCAPAEFCWCMSFSGATFTSKTASAKFNMRQQNFRYASKNH